MMIRKKCGYHEGFCVKMGECDFTPEGFGDLLTFNSFSRQVRQCPYLRLYQLTPDIAMSRQRRRRDWEVGSPYERSNTS